MKKQFQILATTFISIAIASCSKQSIEMPEEAAVKPSEEISKSASRPYVDPLTVNLEASFQFDGNLKDQTKKLPDGISTARLVTYTQDRKGNLKNAIYLDSTYGIKIKSVPQQTHTSMSIWIKPANVKAIGLSYIAGSDTFGPEMNQISNLLTGGVAITGTSAAGTATFSDKSWRHLVVTYDGTSVKFYINGVFMESYNQPGSIPVSLSDYFVGCLPGFNKWKGAIDDLRFYSRTLTATDIQKLYNL